MSTEELEARARKVMPQASYDEFLAKMRLWEESSSSRTPAPPPAPAPAPAPPPVPAPESETVEIHRDDHESLEVFVTTIPSTNLSATFFNSRTLPGHTRANSS